MDGVVRFIMRFPPELHRELKDLAQREGRSLHGQIVYMLRRALEGGD
jgi:hypothetical protein